MIVSIHQPQYLPWIPYFSKIKESDVFVFFDDVQFQKNGLQNRNYILSKNGELRLTIPVFHSLSDNINDIKISDARILKKHWQSIELNYKKAPYFEAVANIGLREIYLKEYSLLCELNIDIIKFYLNFLDINTQVVRSSEIEKQGVKSDLVLSICKKLKAISYLTGTGGLEYLNLDDFKKSNIAILPANYTFKEYKQINQIENKFVPNLSMMDLIFNEGKNAINYL
jgi:hypothetical protein